MVFLDTKFLELNSSLLSLDFESVSSCVMTGTVDIIGFTICVLVVTIFSLGVCMMPSDSSRSVQHPSHLGLAGIGVFDLV